MENKQELLQLVKRKCYQISQTDTEENIKRLIDIIDDAVVKVKRLIGMSVEDKFDFSKPGDERNLFLNYCFYAWNDKEEYFKDNYLDDILSLRAKYTILYKDKENIEND